MNTLTASRSTSRFCAPKTYLRTVAPNYVRTVVPQFEHRKKVANLCVRLRSSEQIYALLQTVGLYCGCLGHFFWESPFSGKGGIRLRRRKTYYLDQMDHSSYANIRLIVIYKPKSKIFI